MKLLLHGALGLVLSIPGLGAQGPTVSVCGGSLGNVATYDLAGKPGARFILVTSLQRDSIPLTFLDPTETRTLDVGLDLAAALLFDALDSSGRLRFGLSVPNDPTLAGVNILHQMVTVPGPGGAAIDGISDVVVIPIEPPGAFVSGAATLSVPRLAATGIDLGNGRLLVAGGGTGTILFQVAHQSTEVFDLATRSFTPGPNLNAARASHTQTQLLDGRYLLAGGVDANNNPVASAEIFDPVTQQFSAVAPMTAARTLHAATLLADGRVLVSGGSADMSSTTAAVTSQLRATEIYDPSTNGWSPGPSMVRPRSGHGLAQLSTGQVLVVGGFSYAGIFTFRIPNIQRTAELMDLVAQQSRATGSMADTRALFSTMRLPSGEVLAAGGLSGDITAGGIGIAAVARFDPVTETWSTVAPMPTPTVGGVVVPLRDGRLAAMGGGGGTIYVPTQILRSSAWDPTTSQWSLLPPMQSGHLVPVAFELQACGLAVFGGGAVNSGAALDTYELSAR